MHNKKHVVSHKNDYDNIYQHTRKYKIKCFDIDKNNNPHKYYVLYKKNFHDYDIYGKNYRLHFKHTSNSKYIPYKIKKQCQKWKDLID